MRTATTIEASGGPWGETVDFVVEAERLGLDVCWVAEAWGSDAPSPLGFLAARTERLLLGSGVVQVGTRSPALIAQTALTLQEMSQGRFLLGLGSQVKPHIERRFAMPWSHPARRMREYVQAMRAIWASWNTGERLAFRGEFYSHTLMTPFFSPAPSPYGPPAVYLAAVGDQMTRVAGEVCDGLLPHAFTTERYLREHTLPVLQDGLAASGRTRADFTIAFSGFVVSGTTEEEMAGAARGVREQIAFYGSTPAYRPVLDLHGWGELGVELNRLSRGTDADRWQRMGELVDDEVLAAFAVVAEPDRLGSALLARFGGLADRFTFYAPYAHDAALFAPATEDLHRA
jgi:probable F420-dependent oxidoreductase